MPTVAKTRRRPKATPKRTRVESVCGKYAHVPTSSAKFAAEKRS
jgi:hypothetical protein